MRQNPQIGYLLGSKYCRQETQTEFTSSPSSKNKRQRTDLSIAESEMESLSEDDLSQEDQQDHEFRIDDKRKPKTVTVALPTKTIVNLTSQMADRTGLSVRSHFTMQSNFVNIAGGD